MLQLRDVAVTAVHHLVIEEVHHLLLLGMTIGIIVGDLGDIGMTIVDVHEVRLPIESVVDQDRRLDTEGRGKFLQV